MGVAWAAVRADVGRHPVLTAAGVLIVSLLGLLALAVAAIGLGESGDLACLNALEIGPRPEGASDVVHTRSDYELLGDRFECTYTRRDGGTVVHHVDR